MMALPAVGAATLPCTSSNITKNRPSIATLTFLLSKRPMAKSTGWPSAAARTRQAILSTGVRLAAAFSKPGRRSTVTSSFPQPHKNLE